MLATPSDAQPAASATLSAAERQRYARHLSLAEIGEAGQARLRAARVLIVGAGGLGCPAALYLAAALNPGVHLIAHAIELCAANVRETFAPYDLIVDGSDRIGTRYLVNDACVLYGKPLVSAAIHRFEGQAMSYVPGRGPCYRCLFPEIAEGTLPSCSQAGVLGVLPGVLGSLQATEAIKLLLDIGAPLLGRVLVYDGLSMRFDEFRIARREECAVCGDHPSIHAPQDPPGFCTVEEQRRVPRLLPRELAAALARESGSLRLIDVREPEEFARGHLPGAINVPLPRIEQQGFAAAQAAPCDEVARER